MAWYPCAWSTEPCPRWKAQRFHRQPAVWCLGACRASGLVLPSKLQITTGHQLLRWLGASPQCVAKLLHVPTCLRVLFPGIRAPISWAWSGVAISALRFIYLIGCFLIFHLWGRSSVTDWFWTWSANREQIRERETVIVLAVQYNYLFFTTEVV